MLDCLDRVTPFSWDLGLLKKLGLKPFDIKCHEKHFLGEVVFPGARVKIWITGYPAQCWEFEVCCTEPKVNYKVTTGSGSLSTFWNCIEMLAEDMISVKEVKVCTTNKL